MQEPGSNWQELLQVYKKQITFALLGILLVSVAVLISKRDSFNSNKVEATTSISNNQTTSQIRAEVEGAVANPGVYTLDNNSRIDDLIVSAGGFSANADLDLVAKTINRASVLKDGQKIYIPSSNQQSSVLSATNDGEGLGETVGNNVQVLTLININSASEKDLESLWGIGPVTAQKIIEQRPYSDIEDLVTKKIVKQNVYDKIKDQISVY